MGLIFEIPLVMFILARMGAVTPRFLSRFRRYALVLAFVLGAIITPTLDPVNQTLVAVPIVVLYEFGILLAKFGQKLRAGNKHLMVKND
jgi:sec-independent protein translocase protein TatC